MAETIRASWWGLYDSWPLERVNAFDRAIDKFETAWQNSQNPPIASVLDQVPAEEQTTWLAELLAVEIVARWTRGESLTPDEFLNQFPDQVETVRCVWTEVSRISPTVAFSQRSHNIAPSPAQKVYRRGRYFRPDDLLDGRYKIEGFVQRGGMGELYRARRIADGLPFAVKVMSVAESDPEEQDQFRARFFREIEILCRLRHEHLASAIEPLQIPQRPPVVVMDWIDGLDLDQVVCISGPMPWNTACEVIRQAAGGLGYAWRKLSLVHRDVKPSNLMLTFSGESFILDFGLARASLVAGNDLAEGDTVVGERFGTPAFMAPEQWDDARRVTAATDVYSLGCTLFFLLTGQEPFAGSRSSEHSLAEAHRCLPPPAIESFRPDVPAELAQLLQRMLAKDPAKRPANGDDLAQQLAPWTSNANLQRWIAGKWSQSQFVAAAASRIDSGHSLFALGRRMFLAAGFAGVGILGGLGWAFRSLYLPIPEVLHFEVALYRGGELNAPEKIGVIGRTIFAAQLGNQLQLQVALDTPAYVQVFAANATGAIQLLVTSAEDPSPAVEKPQRTQLDFKFPRQEHWTLDDAQGLQAFALIASRDPLPSFAEWSASSNLPTVWTRLQQQGGVWTSRGNNIEPLFPPDETPRGHLTTIVPAPLQRLWELIRKNLAVNVTAAIIAFPVDH